MNAIETRPVQVPAVASPVTDAVTALPPGRTGLRPVRREQPDVESKAVPVVEDKVADPQPWEVHGKAPLAWKATTVGMAAALGVTAAKVALAVAVAPTLGGALVAGGVAVAAVAGGYAMADLASGAYHWAIDNYPNEKTPLLGEQAKEFQEHHADGDEMAGSNMWYVLKPTGQNLLVPAIALAVLAPVTGLGTLAATAAAGTFMGAAWGAQAFHKWAHTPNPGPFPRFLQNIHVAIARQNHLDHHALQYPVDNYCIINGMWNKTLAQTDFWRKAERLVYRITGREPNSWKNADVRAKALGLPVPEKFDIIKPFGPEYYKTHNLHAEPPAKD